MDYGIYTTQGKKTLLGNRATVNGRDAIAYVKNGQLQSYAYMDTLHHSFIPVPVWHLKTRKKISVLDFGTGLTYRRTCESAKPFDTTCRCCSNNVVSRGRHSDNPN